MVGEEEGDFFPQVVSLCSIGGMQEDCAELEQVQDRESRHPLNNITSGSRIKDRGV